MNKYGILFKKQLEEKYNEKYEELKRKGKLFEVVNQNVDLILNKFNIEQEIATEKVFDYIDDLVAKTGKEDEE